MSPEIYFHFSLFVNVEGITFGSTSSPSSLSVCLAAWIGMAAYGLPQGSGVGARWQHANMASLLARSHDVVAQLAHAHYTTAQIQRRSVGRYKPFQHLTVGRYKLITTHI